MFDQLLNKAKQALPNMNPDLWKQYGSTIETLVVDNLLNLTEDKLVNDSDLRAVIAKVYELLPTPIRLVLPRDTIINKILEQKAPILAKVANTREKRKASQSA